MYRRVRVRGRDLRSLVAMVPLSGVSIWNLASRMIFEAILVHRSRAVGLLLVVLVFLTCRQV